MLGQLYALSLTRKGDNLALATITVVVYGAWKYSSKIIHEHSPTLSVAESPELECLEIGPNFYDRKLILPPHFSWALGYVCGGPQYGNPCRDAQLSSATGLV